MRIRDPEQTITVKLTESVIEKLRSDFHRAEFQRDMERRLARETAEEVELRRAGGLRVGDVICMTESGTHFSRHERITRIGQTRPPREGYLWVEYDLMPGWAGTGGSTMKEDEIVLVERRS